MRQADDFSGVSLIPTRLGSKHWSSNFDPAAIAATVRVIQHLRGRDQLARKRQLWRQEQKMNKMALFQALTFSSLLAFSGANAGTGKATTLMTKNLPDFPGKEGMVEIVEFAPGEVSEPHRHNADVFVYVLEGSIITQVKGDNPQTVHVGDVFFESPTDVHSVSRNASETQPAKLLVFYVKVKGAPPTVLLRDGEK
jgi:quercetin dioxygenase-like cupin family protein